MTLRGQRLCAAKALLIWTPPPPKKKKKKKITGKTATRMSVFEYDIYILSLSMEVWACRNDNTTLALLCMDSRLIPWLRLHWFTLDIIIHECIIRSWLNHISHLITTCFRKGSKISGKRLNKKGVFIYLIFCHLGIELLLFTWSFNRVSSYALSNVRLQSVSISVIFLLN